tara:strand:+ start:675 stop:1232 length:558 start_codon:yes stop_codon:yes gene_type:complete
MVKKKACIFISGKGTNLKTLIKNSNTYNFPISIDYIVSNTKEAGGLFFANLYKIDFGVFNLKIKLEQEKLLRELKKRNIFLICLAGYMRVLSKSFIKRFQGKIINIHPSLLPKYKGLNTFSKVLNSNDKFTGCTVHYVNEKLDSGKIILKKKVSILQNDDAKSLKIKVQKKEYIAYSEAIIRIFN